MPDSKFFTFFKPKNDLFGQFLDPTCFRAEGAIYLFFGVFGGKNLLCRAAEGGPKKIALFWGDRRRRPKTFLPLFTVQAIFTRQTISAKSENCF